MKMFSRFCIECKNFEDRMEIDRNILCAKNHYPGVSCSDFQDKYEGMKNTASRTRFCIDCKNFEDRRDIEGFVVCAKGHTPGFSCPDFQDRLIDIFYSYIYWSYLYNTGQIDKGKDYFEKKFSRKLSAQELAYACLAEYFDLGLDYSDFIKCWKIVRKIYKQKIPIISEILDEALKRFDSYGEKINLKAVFLDLLYYKKSQKIIIKEISGGFYRK